MFSFRNGEIIENENAYLISFGVQTGGDRARARAKRPSDLPAPDSRGCAARFRGCAARFRGFAAKTLLPARQQDRQLRRLNLSKLLITGFQ